MSTKICACGLGIPEGEGNAAVVCNANNDLVVQVDSINCAALPQADVACTEELVCAAGQVRVGKQALILLSGGTRDAAFGSPTGVPIIPGVPIISPQLCFPEFQNGPCFPGSYGLSYYINYACSNSAAGKFTVDHQQSLDGGLTWGSIGVFQYITGLLPVRSFPFAISFQANAVAVGQFSPSNCYRTVWSADIAGGTLYEVSLRAERTSFVSGTNV